MRSNRSSSAEAPVFAYLAAMEVDRTRPWFPRVKKEWILGKNKAWKSVVLDLRLAEVRNYLLELAQNFWDLGYRGFFLDTLDSHIPLVKELAKRRAVEKEIGRAHV